MNKYNITRIRCHHLILFVHSPANARWARKKRMRLEGRRALDRARDASTAVFAATMATNRMTRKMICSRCKY